MKYSSLDNLAETLSICVFKKERSKTLDMFYSIYLDGHLKAFVLLMGLLLVEYELFFCSLPCHLSVRCRIPYTRSKLRHRLHCLLCSPYFT